MIDELRVFVAMADRLGVAAADERMARLREALATAEQQAKAKARADERVLALTALQDADAVLQADATADAAVKADLASLRAQLER